MLCTATPISVFLIFKFISTLPLKPILGILTFIAAGIYSHNVEYDRDVINEAISDHADKSTTKNELVYEANISYCVHLALIAGELGIITLIVDSLFLYLTAHDGYKTILES